MKQLRKLLLAAAAAVTLTGAILPAATVHAAAKTPKVTLYLAGKTKETINVPTSKAVKTVTFSKKGIVTVKKKSGYLDFTAKKAGKTTATITFKNKKTKKQKNILHRQKRIL